MSVEKMGIKKLTVQLQRDITIVISKKYLRKKFEKDKKNEKNINKNSIKNI